MDSIRGMITFKRFQKNDYTDRPDLEYMRDKGLHELAMQRKRLNEEIDSNGKMSDNEKYGNNSTKHHYSYKRWGDNQLPLSTLDGLTKREEDMMKLFNEWSEVENRAVLPLDIDDLRAKYNARFNRLLRP